MIKNDILNDFSGKRVLVTGGTGLIGRQVVDILKEFAEELVVVSMDKVPIFQNIEHIFGDLTDFGFCKKVTSNIDYVFHIAGVGASVKAAEKKVASHFVPTLMMNTNVLEACRLNDVKKLVFTSSVGAYASADIFRESDYRIDTVPMDFAGWAKRMAEAQISAYKTQYEINSYAIVRPSNVYGPGDNFDPENALVIPSLMYRIYNGENPLIVWGNGEAIRDFVFSRDVAEGIILALYYGTKSGFANLGSGQPCSIKELIETMRKFIDFNYRFDSSKPQGVKKRLMDISLARRELGYEPTTNLEIGLKKTWEWFVNNPEEHNKKMNYFKGNGYV